MRGLRRTHEACLVAVGLVIWAGIALPGLGWAAPSGMDAPLPPARSDNDLPPADSPSSADQAAPPAAPTTAPTTDGETPHARPRVAPRIHLPSPEEDVAPSWFRHPGNALTFDLGFFAGGSDLASTQDANGNTVGTISLGSGVLFSVGGMVTPLWIGDSAGFGVGAFAGVKYDSLGASNGSVSITRFPLGAALHVLLHINENWWLFFRGGIQKEYGISISGDGDLAGNADLQGSLGGFGEGGVYWIMPFGERHTAMVFTIRYGPARDSIGGMSFDANSGGLIVALHYNFI